MKLAHALSVLVLFALPSVVLAQPTLDQQPSAQPPNQTPPVAEPLTSVTEVPASVRVAEEEPVTSDAEDEPGSDGADEAPTKPVTESVPGLRQHFPTRLSLYGSGQFSRVLLATPDEDFSGATGGLGIQLSSPRANWDIGLRVSPSGNDVVGSDPSVFGAAVLNTGGSTSGLTIQADRFIGRVSGGCTVPSRADIRTAATSAPIASAVAAGVDGLVGSGCAAGRDGDESSGELSPFGFFGVFDLSLQQWGEQAEEGQDPSTTRAVVGQLDGGLVIALANIRRSLGKAGDGSSNLALSATLRFGYASRFVAGDLTNGPNLETYRDLLGTSQRYFPGIRFGADITINQVRVFVDGTRLTHRVPLDTAHSVDGLTGMQVTTGVELRGYLLHLITNRNSAATAAAEPLAERASPPPGGDTE